MLYYVAHVWWSRVNVGLGTKPFSLIQRMACLGVTGVLNKVDAGNEIAYPLARERSSIYFLRLDIDLPDSLPTEKGT